MQDSKELIDSEPSSIDIHLMNAASLVIFKRVLKD